MEHFSAKGFTDGQAKLKFVLDDKRVTAACVGRENIEHLKQNVAAALDKKELTQLDKEVLKNYAAETCSGYCAGCANICGSVVCGRSRQRCYAISYVLQQLRRYPNRPSALR